ncbi:MAG TPA: universal stress protein [Candidatus Deferrimicrobiaceae bacterium]|jgi:nucleotide-binding universal stress UspA family protein
MYSKILVPLDGSRLAEAAIGHALELAHGNGAEIVLVNAAQDSLAAVPEARINVSSLQVYAGAIRGMMYLQEVANRIRRCGTRVQCDVLEGEPAPAILSCARKEDVDVIVMGTHRRTGLSRMFKGSVAETVAAAANRPVILVKEGVEASEELAKAA